MMPEATPTPTETPLPAASRHPADLEQPRASESEGIAPRLRNVILEIASRTRQRTTLVIALMVTGIISASAFAYLVLRRR